MSGYWAQSSLAACQLPLFFPCQSWKLGIHSWTAQADLLVIQWVSTLACVLLPARLAVASDCTLPTGFSSKATCLYGGRREWMAEKGANLKNVQLRVWVSYLLTFSLSQLCPPFSNLSPIWNQRQNHPYQGLLVVPEINKGSHNRKLSKNFYSQVLMQDLKKKKRQVPK